MLPIERIVTRYYLRMIVRDEPGALAAIANVLGENLVSIEQVVQRACGDSQAEIVWITHKVEEARLRAAVEGIARLPAVLSLRNWLRVES